MPERVAGAVGVIAGGLLTALLMSILSGAARPGSYLRLMFLPQGVLRLVPWAIVFLFFWSIILLLMRAVRLRGQQGFLQSRAGEDMIRLLEARNPAAAVDLLRREKAEERSILLRRAQRALEEWQVSGTVEAVDNVLRHHAELDSDATASGYALVRVFVWAMPVLGLIGTVIGISLAVTGFSGFLGGEVTAKIISTQLGKVTSGLSFAFLITLDGLLGALLVMLPTAGIQKAEEDFLTAVDRFCVDEIVPRLQGRAVAAPQAGFSVDIGAKLAEVLEKQLPSAAAWREQMDAFTHSALQRLSDGCIQMAGQVRTAAAAEGDQLRELAERVGAKFVEVGDQLHKDFAGTQKQMSEDTARAVAEFAKLSAAFAATLEQHQKQFARTAQELAALSAQAERMTEVQRALTASLDRLGTIDSLAKALAGVTAMMESLRPVLARLSGPLEFRIAPAAGSSGGASGS